MLCKQNRVPKGYPSLDSPIFSFCFVYTRHKGMCDSQAPENAKSSGISSSQWMKCQGFLGCGEPENTLIVGFHLGHRDNREFRFWMVNIVFLALTLNGN